MSLVEYNDASGDVVKLAATRGFIAEKGFEKLDIGGDHHRHIPVLSSKATRKVVDTVLRFVTLFVIAVMLQDMFRPQNILKNFGVLLDDRGEGNRIDYPAQAEIFSVCNKMLQGKRQGRKGFAATGGNGKREKTRR